MPQDTSATSDDGFGSRLREFRVQRGLSQLYLANRVGVSQRKLSDIERGKRAPLLLPSQFIRIADELDVTVARLAGLPDQEHVADQLTLVVSNADRLLDDDVTLLAQLSSQLARARAAGSGDRPASPQVRPGSGRGRPRTTGRLASLGQPAAPPKGRRRKDGAGSA